jgi:ABC transport system ATP-binding/permease protein
VFLVSHDRMFLDNVVTQVIVAEGQGKWREFVGGYSDWERVRDTIAAPPAPIKGAAKAAAKAEPPAATAAPAAAQAKQKKLSYKEQRELEELPLKIAALEDEQTALTLQLSDPDFYKKNAAEARRVQERIEQIELELMGALERWEAIEART